MVTIIFCCNSQEPCILPLGYIYVYFNRFGISSVYHIHTCTYTALTDITFAEVDAIFFCDYHLSYFFEPHALES
jgi:hypothetical protein